MKLGTSFVLTVAVAEAADLYKAPKGVDKNGHKITGRHPKRRLQSINKFMCSWLDDNVGGTKADRMCSRFSKQISQYDSAFDRETCAFYDPDVKNGGPNPDQSMKGLRAPKNPNSKREFVERRLRRDADDEEEASDDHLEECDGTETNEDLIKFCENETRSVTPQARKLKRYTTSLMKWCERYISECHGQRVHQHCVNRGLKLYQSLIA